MSEMIDRVAKAILKARAPGQPKKDWSKVAAEAAILAMREPDEAMLRAYYETKCPPGDSPMGGFSSWAKWSYVRECKLFMDEMRKCWQASIDAALTKRED